MQKFSALGFLLFAFFLIPQNTLAATYTCPSTPTATTNTAEVTVRGENVNNGHVGILETAATNTAVQYQGYQKSQIDDTTTRFSIGNLKQGTSYNVFFTIDNQTQEIKGCQFRTTGTAPVAATSNELVPAQQQSNELTPANCPGGTTGCKIAVNTGCATDGTNKSDGKATGFKLCVKLKNPLQVNDISEAIRFFMNLVMKIALPIIIIFFVWSGLSFILARGNPEKIKEAKRMFLFTIIGTLLVLGAWTITNAIIGTINSITN